MDYWEFKIVNDNSYKFPITKFVHDSKCTTTDNLSLQMVVRFFQYYCKKNIKKKKPTEKERSQLN